MVIRNNLVAVEELHQGKLLEQIGLAQKQVDVSESLLACACRVIIFLQRWLGDRLLMEKEAKALAEEDYELAEQLSRQLEATGLKAEQDMVSAGLIVVSVFVSMVFILI